MGFLDKARKAATKAVDQHGDKISKAIDQGAAMAEPDPNRAVGGARGLRAVRHGRDPRLELTPAKGGVWRCERPDHRAVHRGRAKAGPVSDGAGPGAGSGLPGSASIPACAIGIRI